jgi:uncharacterized membrane protein YqjE
MVSKDQGIGGAILAACVLVAVGYLVLIIAFPKYQLDAVLILVSIAFIAILAIGAWIGWTMATTPPPKPIEEITTEIEEKKEEPKAETPASTEATATEPAKKKK